MNLDWIWRFLLVLFATSFRSKQFDVFFSGHVFWHPNIQPWGIHPETSRVDQKSSLRKLSTGFFFQPELDRNLPNCVFWIREKFWSSSGEVTEWPVSFQWRPETLWRKPLGGGAFVRYSLSRFHQPQHWSSSYLIQTVHQLRRWRFCNLFAVWLALAAIFALKQPASWL